MILFISLLISLDLLGLVPNTLDILLYLLPVIVGPAGPAVHIGPVVLGVLIGPVGPVDPVDPVDHLDDDPGIGIFLLIQDILLYKYILL
jgi:hypothetical protein